MMSSPWAFGYGADDGGVLAVVDVDEVQDLLVSETATGGHETIIQGLLGQGVEQVPHKWFVGGMHRPERNLGAVVEQGGGLHLPRGQQHPAVEIGQFGVQVLWPPGLGGKAAPGTWGGRC